MNVVALPHAPAIVETYQQIREMSAPKGKNPLLLRYNEPGPTRVRGTARTPSAIFGEKARIVLLDKKPVRTGYLGAIVATAHRETAIHIHP
jgi:hypothetical protein